MTWAPTLLTNHVPGQLDDLAMVLHRRRVGDRAWTATGDQIAELDQRIVAGLDALHVFGSAMVDLLEPLVDGDSMLRSAVLAAFLTSAEPSAHRHAWAWFAAADPAEAWDHAATLRIIGIAPASRADVPTSATPPMRYLGEAPSRISDAPTCAAISWWWDGLENDAEISTSVIDAGFADADDGVVPWLARQRGKRLTLDTKGLSLSWAARLGLPREAAAIAQQIAALPASVKRSHLIADLGHPSQIPLLLHALNQREDPALAWESGVAFTRLTGLAIDSDERIELPDATDPAFNDRVWRPDVERAERGWKSLSSIIGEAPRIAGGQIITTEQATTDSTLARRVRYDALLRQSRAAT